MQIVHHSTPPYQDDLPLHFANLAQQFLVSLAMKKDAQESASRCEHLPLNIRYLLHIVYRLHDFHQCVLLIHV